MAETLTGSHVHSNAGISVARVPPVVRDVRLDEGCVSLSKSANTGIQDRSSVSPFLKVN
jgi:hypothetical protein